MYTHVSQVVKYAVTNFVKEGGLLPEGTIQFLREEEDWTRHYLKELRDLPDNQKARARFIQLALKMP